MERLESWLSCSVAYGAGGLGRHFGELVESLRQSGGLRGYFCSRPKPGDEAIATAVHGRYEGLLLRWSPARFSQGWRNYIAGELFDRAAAATTRPATAMFIGFAGQSLHSFRRARAQRAECLELVAANSHVDNVQRQHAAALRRYPYEDSWLNGAQRRKILQEYRMADRIQVASGYSWNSMLAAGIPEHKLCKFCLTPDPRFRPAAARVEDGIFRVVYVGSLTVSKGIPVLVEAFRRLGRAAAELTLVGGWASRGMRRYCAELVARDPRIRIVQGDPLPYLQRADVYVHPTFEDGFAYAPAEALACGVPVIVTQDTGMKELVREGRNGYIIPTGSVDALVERLAHLGKHPLPAAP